MPRFPACSGSPAVSPMKQATLSWPAIDQATGLALTLPTSEPASPQVEYTIGVGHLPTITGDFPPFLLAPVLMVGGRNTSGTSRTVSYRVLINGASIITGSTSSFSNNYYYGLSVTGWGDGSVQPAVGDTVAIKVWANGAGVSLDNKALHMNVTRLGIGLSRRILCIPAVDGSNLAFTDQLAGPSWATANANGAIFFRIENAIIINYQSTSHYQQILLIRGNYGVGRIRYGDHGSSGVASVSTATSSNTTMTVYCERQYTKFAYFYVYVTP